ncbi:hypothetical protein B6264_29380 [Kitasatospora aureofaciens]|nr:hypothetical protein B6264_29380 [Kitasatospora aureofaciens]
MPEPGGTYTELVLEGLARDPGRVALHHGGVPMTAQECLDTVYRMARALDRAGPGSGAGTTGTGSPCSPGTPPRRCWCGWPPTCWAAGWRCRTRRPRSPIWWRRRSSRRPRPSSTTRSAADWRPGPWPEPCRPRASSPAGPAVPGGASPGADLLELAGACSTAPLEPRYRPEDVMAVRFTGGTGGRPKGVLRRFARPPRPAVLSGPASCSAPPCATAGGTTADFSLAAGGAVVLQDGFAAEEVLGAVERHRVSRAYLPPHLLHRLLDHPLLAATDTGSLRRVGYTGCAPSPRRLAEATRRLGRVPHQTYSLTETGPISRLSPDEHLDPRLLTTAGRPYPDTEVRILDEEGVPLPPGRTGEICVRTPTAMAGYWRDPELTARVLREGWLHTGDLGAMWRVI